MAEGEFALVRQHIEEALHKESVFFGVGDHDLYTMLVDVAVLQSDEVALQQYLPPAQEAAARYGHTLYQAIVDRAWGVAHRLAGDYVKAEAQLNDALTIFREMETLWQLGRTHVELGELALEQVNANAARGHFVEALAVFEELKAVPYANRTLTKLDHFSIS